MILILPAYDSNVLVYTTVVMTSLVNLFAPNLPQTTSALIYLIAVLEH